MLAYWCHLAEETEKNQKRRRKNRNKQFAEEKYIIRIVEKRRKYRKEKDQKRKLKSGD